MTSTALSDEQRERLEALEERLNTGWEMQGEKVDRYWVKLLRQYENLYDELREAGYV